MQLELILKPSVFLGAFETITDIVELNFTQKFPRKSYPVVLRCTLIYTTRAFK